MLTFVKLNNEKCSESIVIIAKYYLLLYVKFVVNEALDYGAILNKCGAGRMPVQTVIANIIAEESKIDDIIGFYEYLLETVKNAELLCGIIKLVDVHKNQRLLSKLVDILLFKIIDKQDSDEYINARVLTAKAIANYKDTSTVGSLLYCLNDKNENYKVRLACADALGRIGDRYAVEPLIDVVSDEDEKSVYVKESATFALGLLGDMSAIDPLVAIMEAKQGVLGKFSFLKEKIVEALARLNPNNDKVLKVLKNSLMDSASMVRINAIEGLMNSDYEEAPNLIKTALHDEDEEVQRNALIALYNIIGKDILDEIISLPGYSAFLKEEAKHLIDEYE